ncbi:DUF2017 domain-containing protein [Nakamurella leprariae]|uniref:DUF2017 domain-containing protein n=1 Tax=Nakamurella leprariae TaxID=2803911 RepID=A0A938YG45_9ACTN|nr:DUF2017 domain-containing protein [Nakamurella leprariae]MBM9467195.1 DUF2017 domain-containing protein [Nakamurella leprariae]
MRPFRRRLGRYVATFTAPEASLVSDLVDQVRHLLAERRSDGSDDPLVALTGVAWGPTRSPQDAAVARLLPDFSAEDPDLSAVMRSLREPELIAAKDQAAVALLDSLPRGGGTVRLDDATAQAWITALNDVRLALGVRLEITEDGDADLPGPHPDAPAAPRDPDGPVDGLDGSGEDEDPSRAPMLATYRWLSAVQDSLVTALLH